MGKQDFRSNLVESGRLSGLKRSTLTRAPSTRFATSNTYKPGMHSAGVQPRFDNRVDARLKLQLKHKGPGLISKAARITDARQLLLSKNKSKIADARQLLLNKRKQQLVKQDLVKSGARRSGASRPGGARNDHSVYSDGLNTLVTLKNNPNSSRTTNVARSSATRKAESILEVDRTRTGASSQNAKYQPIRIKIENNLASSGSFVYDSSARQRRDENDAPHDYYAANGRLNGSGARYAPAPSSSSLSSSLYYNSNERRGYGESESMDVEYSHGGRSESGYTRHSSDMGVGTNSSGHKLFISNLHPRVTEDDVLVIDKLLLVY